ncbi:glycosyltransferase family 61 protein [Pedobacter sp. CCM 8938]|uniref:Glycosyltransferase family 61 protein n=1 Tax=Pedobacter fastidiosus TaxID=2765361 RepID=A0ABR7KVM9_9SPHI|nr:glycosyltransferase family 61 protein [Pedobacter fastidiosus]MBC6112166.1 glycosyltransferase family 61 protein [Pedobacter fastidiosus]
MTKENLKFLLKQFPFIYPKGFIHSAKNYIQQLNNQIKPYLKNRMAQFYLLDVEEAYFLPSPSGLQTEYLDGFTINQTYKTTEKCLFFLPDSFIIGNEGITATNRNYIFEDFAHYFNISSIKGKQYNKPFQNFSLNIKQIQGTTASLLFSKSDNVYHWFFDVLSRVRFYEKVINQIDNFLVPDSVPEHFINLLPLFSIPTEKVIRVKPNEKLHLKYLYVSSLSGSEGRSSLKDIEFLERNLKSIPTQIGKVKYYIKRGKHTSRKIINEDKLVVILEDKGFTILDSEELTFDQQIETFNNASIVVAFHGAELFNLLFVPKNCRVLELFSPDYFRTDCYYNLASLKNLDYHYLVGEKTSDSNWGNCNIDLDLFSKSIDRLLTNE